MSINKNISVIIPVYNGGKYLMTLIDQFKKQSVQDFELIFIDDGSTDNTLALLNQINETMRIKIYHQNNQGVSAARNKGMELVDTEFFTFADVDDIIPKNYIESIIKFTAHNYDVVYFKLQPIESKETNEYVDDTYCEPRKISNEEALEKFLFNPTALGVYNLAIKTEFRNKYNLRFSVGYAYYEDYDFILQTFAQANEIGESDQVLYYYLQNDNSAMRIFNAERINCLELMYKRGEWLKTKTPSFSKQFSQWFVSRLYWSVLWQACASLETYSDFSEFAKLTSAKEHISKLKDYPNKQIKTSSFVFLHFPKLYWIIVRSASKNKHIQKSNFEEISCRLKTLKVSI